MVRRPTSKSPPRKNMRYGAELGALLERHFDNPPYESPHLTGAGRWTPRLFAEAVGVTDSAVRQWLRGDELPTQHLTIIIRELFGPKPQKFHRQSEELKTVFRRCVQRRQEKHPLPENKASLGTIRTYSDPTGDMLGLNYADIDALPVEEDWRFDAIRFGEGVQVVEVPGRSLFWLDPAERLADAHGNRRSLTDYFPADDAGLHKLADHTAPFFPRRVVISGPKRLNATVRIFACTDIPYENGLDEREGLHFEAEAILGLGGIAAFLDRRGEFRQRTDIEMGGGLGCVAALVAIAYDRRRPAYRSRYCLVIRKGIRYPDDVWLSPATGKSVFSSAEPAQARFLFQSREAKGGSTDMFAANFNGSFMVNLNEGDESAWDGFIDEDGRDLARWSGNRVTFGSTVTGKGFVEPIVREDRP